MLDLVNPLYGLRDQDLVSKEFLGNLQGVAPFDAAAIFQIDQHTYEIAQGVCAGSDAGLIDEYLKNHASADLCSLSLRCPTRLNEADLLSRLLTRDPQAAPATQNTRSRFGFEHALTVVAGWRGQPIALLRLHRRAGASNFSDEEISLINGIAPHIAMSSVFNKPTDAQSIGVQRGLLALTSDNRLIYANDSVQELLAELPAATIRALAESGSVWRNDDERVFRLRILALSRRSLLSWIELEASAQSHALEHCNAGAVTVIAVEPIQRRQALATRLARSRLSRREVEVALCVMRGLSNADIAGELGIDEKTVKDHLRRVYGKIDVRSRTAMISKVLGLEAELIPVASAVPKSTCQ
ncbi:helix-turn-helix transcriptional regulator [Thiorhodococcus mannitoliphagus]|uniref:Helix-turn-helix transcriptional regulator n=1 Tax=Thiorhodococcus mannitoliphagus TaxID=329406 RepID=A0A6P1DYH5_9GAMM|nr:helix-turn-helix transcriptional regulator [Thiorhodococcus mannitoliphagus]NEX20625.1 helix-turn-helix transcriptional regulator [Thiorhodococcus mannitoliphagus]